MKHGRFASTLQGRLDSIRRSAMVAALFAFFLFANAATGRAQAHPDLLLHRTVTYADRQTYIELPFDVPEGVTRVTIESSYTERDKHTTIDLGLLTENGFAAGAAAINRPSLSRKQTRPHLIFPVPFVQELGNSSSAFQISGRAYVPNSQPQSLSRTQPTRPQSPLLARHPCVTNPHGIAGTCICTMRTATAPA